MTGNALPDDRCVHGIPRNWCGQCRDAGRSCEERVFNEQGKVWTVVHRKESQDMDGIKQDEKRDELTMCRMCGKRPPKSGEKGLCGYCAGGIKRRTSRTEDPEAPEEAEELEAIGRDGMVKALLSGHETVLFRLEKAADQEMRTLYAEAVYAIKIYLAVILPLPWEKNP